MPSAELPEPFLLELGRLVDAFGQVELEFEIIFAGLINEDQDIGRVLWSLLGGFEGRLSALDNVYTVRFGPDDEYLSRLRALIAEAKNLAVSRNKLIHSAYTLGEGESIRRMRTLRASGGFRVDLDENLTPEDVRRIVRTIRVFWSTLQAFTHTLLDAGRMYPFLPDEEEDRN